MSIFTVFLKNRKFISEIKRSKVTDYAALKAGIMENICVKVFWMSLLVQKMLFEFGPEVHEMSFKDISIISSDGLFRQRITVQFLEDGTMWNISMKSIF